MSRPNCRARCSVPSRGTTSPIGTAPKLTRQQPTNPLVASLPADGEVMAQVAEYAAMNFTPTDIQSALTQDITRSYFDHDSSLFLSHPCPRVCTVTSLPG